MHVPHTDMSELSLPLLYRHILRAAQRFPSIKRDAIVQEIKAEFAANKVPHCPYEAVTSSHKSPEGCCMQGRCRFCM